MPYVRIGQRKVLTKRKRSNSAPAVLIHAPFSKRTKRKQWTDIQMKAAIDAVKSRKCNINRAASDHGVPAATLKNRLSGRIKENCVPGPRRYMNNEEEAELGTFLKTCASIGYGKTRKEVMTIAETHAKQNGLLRKDKITQGWWRNFVSRQGDLSLRKGDNTAHVRMDAINSETMNHYFDLLEKTLKDNNLMNCPSQIYNFDESGMPLDPKAPNIVAQTGTKKVRYRSTGRKGQITIVACGNATGQVMPPTIIFEAKKVNPAWTTGEIPGTMYGSSDKGWITTDLFESWLSEHFIKHAVGSRPLLLLLDGHSTHNQPNVIRLARKNGIIILCLPPHATHEAQPLDCAVFSPLKAQWQKVVHDFIQSNPGEVITKFNFNALFAKAWIASLTPANLMAGFKTCGIYPFNRLAINIPGEGSGNANSSLTTSTTNNADDNTEFSSDVITEDNAFSLVVPEQFTTEQEALFKRRFEEGYDVYIDKDYIRWIKLNHPELQIVANLAPETLDHSSTDVIAPCEEPSYSSNVVESSEEPAPSSNVVVSSEEPASSSNVVVSSEEPASSRNVVGSSEEPASSNNVVASGKELASSRDVITPCEEPIVALPNKVSTVNVSKPPKPGLSDLLTCPALSTSSAPKRPSTRARLLTSDECLRLLEEKEKKKEMETQEKEKRKKKRGRMKGLQKRKKEKSYYKKRKKRRLKRLKKEQKKLKKKPERLAHQKDKLLRRKAPHLSRAHQTLL